jgi:hypothetical protein
VIAVTIPAEKYNLRSFPFCCIAFVSLPYIVHSNYVLVHDEFSGSGSFCSQFYAHSSEEQPALECNEVLTVSAGLKLWKYESY